MVIGEIHAGLYWWVRQGGVVVHEIQAGLYRPVRQGGGHSLSFWIFEIPMAWAPPIPPPRRRSGAGGLNPPPPIRHFPRAATLQLPGSADAPTLCDDAPSQLGSA